VISDGIIAPGYEPGTVECLRKKKNGQFLIIEADDAFAPPKHEAREVFGLRLEQERDTVQTAAALLGNTIGGELPDDTVADLLLGLTVLRFTQQLEGCGDRRQGRHQVLAGRPTWRGGITRFGGRHRSCLIRQGEELIRGMNGCCRAIW
jgi:phosphoribosylaminoimidazolecarboxamide formyltransferase/IMP cyclohydrolase